MKKFPRAYMLAKSSVEAYNRIMRNKITVTGLVQGIGFRPFVAELAEELGLSGQVKNLGGIVEIFVSGDTQAVDSFIHRLRCVEETGELPGCRIDSLNVKEIDVKLWKRLLEFDVDFEEIESAFVEKKRCFSYCRKRKWKRRKTLFTSRFAYL